MTDLRFYFAQGIISQMTQQKLCVEQKSFAHIMLIFQYIIRGKKYLHFVKPLHQIAHIYSNLTIGNSKKTTRLNYDIFY